MHAVRLVARLRAPGVFAPRVLEPCARKELTGEYL